MDCLYCQHVNTEDDHRCIRCGRRLPTAPPRTVVETYPVSTGSGAAMAVRALERPATPAPSHTGEPVRVARQQMLFTGSDAPKVVAFPKVDPLARGESRPRLRRPSGETGRQPSLDFLPPSPHGPRTLRTSVEAVIYCDAPVATTLHRAVACGLDLSMILIAMGLFVLTFHICGGELVLTKKTIPYFAGAFACVSLFYGILWVLAGSDTAGARWTGLRLINFDGAPLDRRERFFRFAAACLSFGAAGLGVAWSLADEESLTWHDHMSKTFPTTRAVN